MAEFPEVTLRFLSDSRGQCIDQKAKIVHGYIVSEKYGVAFPLPSQPAKTYKLDNAGHPPAQTGAEYIFAEDAGPPEQDSKFVNTFLVKVYQDAKEGKLC